MDRSGTWLGIGLLGFGLLTIAIALLREHPRISKGVPVAAWQDVVAGIVITVCGTSLLWAQPKRRG